MKCLVVNDKFNNCKLISFLESQFPACSRNVFFKALRKKNIRVNDVKVSNNILLCSGDVVKVYVTDEFLFPKFSIVYEDENILAVNKPKGIEVTGENSLTSLLEKDFPCVLPCHRLDRNTEGLVIFAKSEPALEILLDKFKMREVSKFYKCKVYGILDKKQDILHAFLFKDNKKSFVYVSDCKKRGYVEIVTEYRVLDENFDENYSVLEVALHTGRTHQIRAHLAHIGHPIIGDR